MASEPSLTENEILVLKILNEDEGLDEETICNKSGIDRSTLDETLNHLEQLHGAINKDNLWFPPKKEQADDDSPDKKLLINGLHFLRWQALAVAVKLALGLLIARWLRVEHFGMYSLIYTSAYLLATLSALGFPVQLSRVVPLYIQQNQLGLLHGYIRFAVGTPFKLGMFFFLVSIPIVSFLPSTQGVVEEWITGYALIPLLAVGFVLEGILASRKQWLASLFMALIVPAIFIPLAFVITHYFQKSEMEFIFIAMGFSVLIGLAIERHFCAKALPSKMWKETAIFKKKEWTKTALEIFVIASFVVILLNGDLLVVGYIKGKHSAGLYSVVLSLLMPLPLWGAAINAVSNPDIPVLLRNGDMAGLQRLITKGIRLVFKPTLALGLIYIIFGEYFLSFYGKGFVEAYPVLVIMSLLFVAKAASGNAGYLLMMAGKPDVLAKTLYIIVALDFVLLFILTPLFGIVGAAFSTVIASMLSRIVLYRKCKKHVGIRVTMFAALKES